MHGFAVDVGGTTLNEPDAPAIRPDDAPGRRPARRTEKRVIQRFAPQGQGYKSRRFINWGHQTSWTLAAVADRAPGGQAKFKLGDPAGCSPHFVVYGFQLCFEHRKSTHICGYKNFKYFLTLQYCNFKFLKFISTCFPSKIRITRPPPILQIFVCLIPCNVCWVYVFV